MERHVRMHETGGRVRLLVLCLTVMFALAGIAAASASAKLPEWGKCELTAEHTGGKYADPGCTVPVKKVHHDYPGGYEWTPLGEGHENFLTYSESHPVEQPSGLTIVLADGHTVKCGVLEGEDELSLTFAGSQTTIAPLLRYERCVNDEGYSCNSTDSAAPGEFTTEGPWGKAWEEEEGGWTGTLRYIEGKDGSHPVVGIAYQTNLEHEAFTTVNCKGAGAIQGLVIGGDKHKEALTAQFTQVNEMRTGYTVSFNQSGSVQQPAEFEGKKATPLHAQLNGGEWETIGLEATMTFPEVYSHNGTGNKEEFELKATP